jgi:hypothetical protein
MYEPGLSQDEHIKKHIRTTHRILSEHKKPPQESETLKIAKKTLKHEKMETWENVKKWKH